MSVETPKSEKKLDPKSLGYGIERRKHIRPPGNYVAIFLVTELTAIAALWAIAIFSGVRGTSITIGAAVATFFLLMSLAESTRGESRINIVPELSLAISLYLNHSESARNPAGALAVIFVAVVILDFGFWTWPFPFSYRDKSWIRP